MRRAILSRALAIGQRLAIFLTATAHWMEICFGIVIVDKSVPSVLYGTDLQLMGVCTVSVLVHLQIQPHCL